MPKHILSIIWSKNRYLQKNINNRYIGIETVVRKKTEMGAILIIIKRVIEPN